MRLDADEARRRFATGRVACLATLRADGTPALVPIVFAMVGETVVAAVDAKAKQTRELARLRHVARDPRVTVLVDHYEEDWQRLWWVRAEGAGRVVASGSERDEVIASLRAKYPQYEGLDGPFGDAIIVEVARWMGWSAS
jgi:PPOX class probable F420-dependent enzyme